MTQKEFLVCSYGLTSVVMLLAEEFCRQSRIAFGWSDIIGLPTGAGFVDFCHGVENRYSRRSRRLTEPFFGHFINEIRLM